MADPLIGAIEAGGTKFVCALARPDRTIVARTRLPTRAPDETLPALRAWFKQAAAAHGPIAAFGVASFGPLDLDPASPGYGAFTTTPKPGWRGARIGDALAGFAGAPVALDTDVNGAALGEFVAGAGRGCGTLAYVTVGTGIGAGVVRDGRSLDGFSHYEMGHIRPPHDRAADPFAGLCPSHGDCLEGLASGPAILARWGRDLSALADRPEALALIGGYLGHFAATLALMHMPERIVFGGGVAKTPGLLAATRAAALRELAGYVAGPFAPGRIAATIVAPALGDDAGITGAIELGRRALTPAPPPGSRS
jgi:fructokinase